MATANALIVSSLSQPLSLQSDYGANFPKEYLPFLSRAFVSFVGSSHEAPIVILRNIGASQSLVVETVLPISYQSDTGGTVL